MYSIRKHVFWSIHFDGYIRWCFGVRVRGGGDGVRTAYISFTDVYSINTLKNPRIPAASWVQRPGSSGQLIVTRWSNSRRESILPKMWNKILIEKKIVYLYLWPGLIVWWNIVIIIYTNTIDIKLTDVALYKNI